LNIEEIKANNIKQSPDCSFLGLIKIKYCYGGCHNGQIANPSIVLYNCFKAISTIPFNSPGSFLKPRHHWPKGQKGFPQQKSIVQFVFV
jgi:hypothetical protein